MEHEAGQPVNVQLLIPPFDQQPEAKYANYVSVGHSQYEVTLLFGQVPSGVSEIDLKAINDSGRVLVRPVVRISIAHNLLQPLINALTSRQHTIDEAAKEGDQDAAVCVQPSE